MTKVKTNGEDLSLRDVVRVARDFEQVDLEEGVEEKIKKSRNTLENWLKEEKIMYGVTTGFGPFVSALIPSKYQSELQNNLVRSHSSNVGPIFPVEETRAAMLLRLNALCKGYSGVRLDVVELLKEMLNKKIHPIIPQWGSVGASGDLTPSAHIALALIGEGEVEYKGKRQNSGEVFKKLGLKSLRLKAKEGLALINGTAAMTGVGSIQVADAWDLLRTAEIISALSIEVLHGSAEPFNVECHKVKAHPGQIDCATNLSNYLSGSKLVWDADKVRKIREELTAKMKAHGDVLESNLPMQNVYSLRATPQILGAVRDALTYITEQVTIEMNSANDNPLIFSDLDLVYQGAHFHGQPIALPMDVLAISLTQIGILSERRLNKILDPARSGGLSPFLARGKAGLRCGFEGAQYIPTALIAECRALSHPISIQSIPSNGENQDVVSMGLVAARRARDIKEKIIYVLAVELLAACEGMEERKKNEMSRTARAVYDKVRSLVPSFPEDRIMSSEIEKAKKIIENGQLVKIVQEIIPEIK